MGKEQKSSGQEFIEISREMSEAWKEMTDLGLYGNYHPGMNDKRVIELREGKRPKTGEKEIARYLRALERLFVLQIKMREERRDGEGP